MPQVRYGVGGEPVLHSLSPMLLALVAAHLKSSLAENRSKSGINIDWERMDVIPATRVEDALAWGYVGALPGKEPNWNYTDSPLPAFRARTIIERVAIMATEEVLTPNEKLNPIGEAILPIRNKKIPGSPTEHWLSLTSPLKHQLSSAAMKFVDSSSEIDSVNALRWNTREWWVASTDGIGLVHVAQHRGIDVSNGAILELHGGGGAARSCADAWSKAGGKLVWSGGRRELSEEGPWSDSLVDKKSDGEIALSINFDVEPGSTPKTSGSGIHVQSAYSPFEGTLSEGIEKLTSEPLDGRWLLCAQHLAAWSTLWCPERAEDLPSLELLLNRLVFAESKLLEF